MNVEADLAKGHLAIEYFAYDELTFVDSDDCETKPSSALPEPNTVCTFDEGDACGWTQGRANSIGQKISQYIVWGDLHPDLVILYIYPFQMSFWANFRSDICSAFWAKKSY